MGASEPKSVNPVLRTIGVNSLKIGGLQLPSYDIITNSFILDIIWTIIRVKYYHKIKECFVLGREYYNMA